MCNRAGVVNNSGGGGSKITRRQNLLEVAKVFMDVGKHFGWQTIFGGQQKSGCCKKGLWGKKFGEQQ